MSVEMRLPKVVILALQLSVALIFVAMGSWKIGETSYKMGGRVGELFTFMAATGIWWKAIGWTQIVAGVLLLVPRFSLVAALVLFGVTVNIALVNIALWPEFGTTMFVTAYALIALSFLLLCDIGRLRSLFAKPTITRGGKSVT